MSATAGSAAIRRRSTSTYDGAAIAVDTGFIVYNEMNYPNLTALFSHLGVATQASEMSFAVSARQGGFEWCGRTHDVANGLFAQRSNLLSPRYLGMLLEVLRFNKQAVQDSKDGVLAGLSLAQYLALPALLDPVPGRLPHPHGRGDLVDVGAIHAGLSRRELRRVLQEPPPPAVEPAGLAHRRGRQPELRGEAQRAPGGRMSGSAPPSPRSSAPPTGVT